MIAFVEMLIPAAEQVGMKVPHDPEDYEAANFPHFYVYERMQIGAAIPYAGAHWDNAKVIADIPDDRIKKVMFADIIALGFHIST